MELEEVLGQLDEQYLEGEDVNKEELIATLTAIHQEVSQDPELFGEFKIDALYICGGIYIPYMFWYELFDFMDNQSNREYIFTLIEVFANGEFGEEEQNKMKPLLLVYFALEKPFELDKLKAFKLGKLHKTVETYFQNLLNFTQKSKASVDNFVTKIKLLRGHTPDFDMLRMPLSKLQEALQQ